MMAKAQAGIDSAFIADLNKFIAAASRVDATFNKELRRAAQEVASELTGDVNARAAGSHARVFGAFKAKLDRYPVVALDGRKVFRRSRAVSRGTGKRRANSTKMSDVFFGAEFGGRGRSTTQQFLPFRGNQGYVFWPTVRANRQKIAEDYLDAITRVWNSVPGGK